MGYMTALLLCTMAWFFGALPGHAQDKFKLRAGAKGKICLKCHDTFRKTLKSPYLHPLLKTGQCSACHDPHTSSHKGLLNASKTKLCYDCHKAVLPEKARSAHKVVTEGNCQKCHDSHGSQNKFMLLQSGNQLCFDCHEDIGDQVKKNRYKHEPLAKEKGCLTCHNPHSSERFGSLLKNDAPVLCVKCHETDKPSFVRNHMNYPVANANCSSCHNPHGSNKKGLVYADAHAPVSEKKCTECHEEPTSPRPLKTKIEGINLCRQCHNKMMDKAFTKNRVHWPLLDPTGCQNCHTPHAAKQKGLLKASVVDVCGHCHVDTVTLQEVSRNDPKNPRLCEPVKAGNCISCHSPHASDNVLLMTEPSISSDLCGRCHQWQTHSTHPIGEKAIDQRNRNLTVECLSCHNGCGTRNKPAMLHFETTYELCVECHVERKR